jgi:glycerol-3-phosphate cytidylyltransferase
MFKESKQHCDYLIVALNKGDNIDYNINPDKKPPLYSVEERKLILDSCKYIDEVIIYNSEEELLDIMKSRKIDIRFLGDDYRGKKITGSELNIPIHYIDRSHGYSSSKIRERIIKNLI